MKFLDQLKVGNKIKFNIYKRPYIKTACANWRSTIVT